MRKHSWECHLVTEFIPQSNRLLGLNMSGGGGSTSQIKIRLRPPGSRDTFYHYEHVLNTMLHELVHNVRGPHDSVFYTWLDKIQAECQEFVSKGIAGTGVGFDAPSVGKLGGRGPIAVHNPGLHQLRDVMLKVGSA
eukprot:jgi/Astpho2/8606/gw1.00126.49.1_t